MVRFVSGTVVCAALVVGCGNSDESVSDSSDQLANLPSCLQTLACAAPPLTAAAPRSWRHPFKSRATVAQGSPNHRGRDLFVNPDAPQTVIAQFAYGLADADLVDEEVDVFVQRDCAHGWEKVGTTLTTASDTDHPAAEGVADHGGRVYFEIPAEKRLGPGLHRIRLVVAGDNSKADLLLDMVPRGTPIFVTDVDGTLTSSESVEFTALLTGRIPGTHSGAPEALRALAAKGYRPVYLTARPEWLTQRTRDFLAEHGFPLGVLHTSLSTAGAGFGAAAADFKKDELADLGRKGLTPAWGFGNKSSDADAYAKAIQTPAHRVFYQLSGGALGGRTIQSYTELLPELNGLERACR